METLTLALHANVLENILSYAAYTLEEYLVAYLLRYLCHSRTESANQIE